VLFLASGEGFYSVRVEIDKFGKMILDTGIEEDKSETVVMLIAWFFVVVMILFILKSPSFLIGFVILVILSPLLWACVTAGIPGRFYSDLFEIDRMNSKVTKSTRGLFLQRSFHRDLRDISALLVVEDKVRYGLLGIGPHIGLFLC
jgi:hypothetical protein